MLSEGQAEADRPHGHAGHPKPYLQHGEHQEAPNNLAAGAHPSSVIIPSSSAWETDHPPSFFHYSLPLPPPTRPQNFSFFTGGALSTRTGFPGPETHFLDRARGKTAAPLPGPFGQGSQKEGSVVGVQEGRGNRSQGFQKGAAGSSQCRWRGAVQSSAASWSPQGSPLPPSPPDGRAPLPFRAKEMSFASRRCRAKLLGASLSPLPARPSPRLCFRGNTKCSCDESLVPQAERAEEIQHHVPRSCCAARKGDLV